MLRHIILIFTLLSAPPIYASNLAGIVIPDEIYIQKHEQPLLLKGAGIRKKFIFDIYIGALYVTNIREDLNNILHSNSPKRIALYFLYDEVSREKLQQGWYDGFMKNNSDSMLEVLQERLSYSLTKFKTMKRGDIIYFDYSPNMGTSIFINNKQVGVIEGFDFIQAILKVWIGNHPAQESLKLAMLGLDS